MWSFLRLSALGVIDEAELELGPGLTVITGETGAGKTMVVTALGLLRGERADSALVRHGAERAQIEAGVTVDPEGPVAEAVIDAGGRIDDELVLGRTLSVNGRSRATAGGTTVPASLLTELTDRLVVVHGQSDQQRLVRPAEQRRALDRFGGAPIADMLQRYEPTYARVRALESRLEELRTHAGERLRELDLLRHGLAEIAAVDPREGEDDDLRAEESRLAHAGSLAEAALRAADLIDGDDDSIASGLSAAAQGLDGASGHDPVLDALGTRVHEAMIELGDVASELRGYGSGIELDPARLAVVQERRAALTTLQRKYGPGLLDVIAWSQQAAARVAELDNDDTAIDAAEAELAELRPELDRLAAELTRRRRLAAEQLALEVAEELAALAMPSARLAVEIQPTEPSVTGADSIGFVFAANSGSALRPIGRAASGGELSRVMLALEVVLADRQPVPTMVFDEVDAGIGGRTAVEVGRRLARLAKHTQVLAVTHLPQVAAFADHHFVVAKTDDGSVTSSDVRRLGESERVDELARMLAGLDESAAAQEHARELLELARSTRG